MKTAVDSTLQEGATLIRYKGTVAHGCTLCGVPEMVLVLLPPGMSLVCRVEYVHPS